MAKSPSSEVEYDAEVVDVLPGSYFRVRLLDPSTGNAIVTAYACGRIRKHRIKIFLTDKVKVQMSPHDTKKGRITLRYEKDRNPNPNAGEG